MALRGLFRKKKYTGYTGSTGPAESPVTRILPRNKRTRNESSPLLTVCPNWKSDAPSVATEGEPATLWDSSMSFPRVPPEKRMDLYHVTS